jgi:hypothetical protein
MTQRTEPLAEQAQGLALRLRGSTLRLSGDPLLMAIVNASPDSFSDLGPPAPGELVERARELAAAGAALSQLARPRLGLAPAGAQPAKDTAAPGSLGQLAEHGQPAVDLARYDYGRPPHTRGDAVAAQGRETVVARQPSSAAIA